MRGIPLQDFVNNEKSKIPRREEAMILHRRSFIAKIKRGIKQSLIDRKVSMKTVANFIGKTDAQLYISLEEERNITLETLADMCFGAGLTIKLERAYDQPDFIQEPAKKEPELEIPKDEPTGPEPKKQDTQIMNIHEHVGAKVKYLLTLNKMTNKEACDLIGVCYNTFNQKINGKSGFNLDELKMIAEFFDKPLDFFMKE